MRGNEDRCNKTISIMQPTYLPWMGYFDLMDQVNIFVLLDSVQFEKRSWQQRNKIKSPKGELLLTVPVLTKGKFDQKINQVKINKSKHFPKDHLKAIGYNYNKAKYFKKIYPELEKILNKSFNLLVDLNIELIVWLKNLLGIKTKIKKSSLLKTRGRKADLLINICKLLNANTYLSPIGSKAYLKDGQIFKANNIRLSYQQFNHPQYCQLYGKFIPYLSILDLLFNKGSESLKVIRSGRLRV